MAAEEKKGKENSLVRYFRETMAELRKVRWPSREETWMLTRVVLVVTLAMAVFLGVLDFVFRQLLSGVLRAQPLYYGLGVIVILGLSGAAYWIAQSGREV